MSTSVYACVSLKNFTELDSYIGNIRGIRFNVVIIIWVVDERLGAIE